MNTKPSGSVQLPIVVNPLQLASLISILSDEYNLHDAEEVELSQSQGPVALHAIFVQSMYVDGDATQAIDVNGEITKIAKNVKESS